MAEYQMDPITLEIALHRLWQVTEEMGITLCRTSGSVVTIDSRDYMTAIYDAQGNCIMSGCGVIFHTKAFAGAVKFLMEDKAEDPGIFEGDIFILNDPYVSALHNADVAAFTPIFYQGKLVGWSATMTHMVDIGGIDPGGISPNARNCFQEGLRFRGLKLVERGKIRKEIFDFLLNSVRDAGMVGLDLRAQIAAGETARRRLAELIDVYGTEGYEALCRQAIKYSEDKFRARIRELPDGSWSTIYYQDGDVVSDKIYQVCLTMTKQGDDFVFDFTGTSEQAPCCVNCTAYGAAGGVFGAIAPLLCYDIPWNQGILNAFRVVVPEGTLISAKFPAACSMGTIGGSFLACNAAIITISQMLTCSDKYREEATAQWSSSSPGFMMSGVNKDGRNFVSIIMEPLCGGGGAKCYEDGVDVAGKPWTPEATHPNVESIELQLPVLYLYRKMVADSAGAGMFRGGVAGEFAMILHDCPAGEISGGIIGMGCEPLMGYGICGAYPSHNIKLRIMRESDIENRIRQGNMPDRFDDLRGSVEVLPSKSTFELRNGDVVSIQWNGGGGYGDPIDREPELVCQDVLNGLVSVLCAEQIYGVVVEVKRGEVIWDETEKRRQALRKERLSCQLAKWSLVSIAGSNAIYPENESSFSAANMAPVRMGEYLEIEDLPEGRSVRCRKCGHRLCDAESNYKEFGLMSEHPLTRSSPGNSTTERFVLREFYCPRCATQLEVEMVLKGSPFIHSYRLKK